MWLHHLNELACPVCSSPLVTQAETDWVETGSLACASCDAQYPIRAGVPRLFPVAAATRTGPAADPRSRASFGYEWLRYPVTTSDEDLVTFVGLTGVEPRFYERVRFRNLFSHVPSAADVAAAATPYFDGKRVFEAGCGMGKYVRVVARGGAEVAIGLDASDSVERAVGLVRELRNACIVQGDLFRPPLRAGFDFAYSVGVLHHTPDARAAFLQVAATVRPGGELAVWLYPRGQGWPRRLVEIWHERLLRPVTSSLPLPVLEGICARLGRLAAYKTALVESGGLWRTAIARILNLVAVGEHRDVAIAAFLNFDWYSPRYRSRHTEAELGDWFRSAGFPAPRLLPVEVSAIGRKGPGASPGSPAPSRVNPAR